MPTDEDLRKLTEFEAHFAGTTHVIVVDHVESVSKSMNRCARHFSGFGHAIWNVDDIRTNNSLELQLESLKRGADLSFGDYICVSKQGQKTGVKVSYPGLTKMQYAERMMGGPFLAFTNSVFQEVAGFDEQFKIASDMDFYLKCLNLNHSRVSYISNNLGYYLDEGSGLSTNPSRRKQLAEERLVIRARFPKVKKEDFDIGLLRSFYTLPRLEFTRKMTLSPASDRSWIGIFSRYAFYMIFLNYFLRLKEKGFRVAIFLQKLFT